MGLFSKFGKNKQEAAGQDSGYYSRADDSAALERARSKRASAADHADGAENRRGNSRREAADPVLPEKKRARRRLVGAIALALAVAVGLPMVLDSEPKPLAADIAIQIPSKDKADGSAPLARVAPPAPASRVEAADALDKSEEIIKEPAPSKPAAANTAPVPVPLAAAKPVVTAAPAVAELKLHADAKLAKLEHKSETKVDSKPDARAEAEAKAKAVAKAEADAKAEAKHAAELKAKAKAEAEAKADAKAKEAESRHVAEAKPVKTEDAARAMAILEDKPSDTHYLVQVAAVTSQEKVDELQSKLKEAGIKSYTQKVTTSSGALTRVRVGPFANKEEAEKVRARLSKIGLSSSLATS
jgi:DedD protein